MTNTRLVDVLLVAIGNIKIRLTSDLRESSNQWLFIKGQREKDDKVTYENIEDLYINYGYHDVIYIDSCTCGEYDHYLEVVVSERE